MPLPYPTYTHFAESAASPGTPPPYVVHTGYGLERLKQEVRRRTRVARLFPNETSCLRLVSAVLIEISDDWETGKAYLTFTDE
jgi:transposase-like protein